MKLHIVVFILCIAICNNSLLGQGKEYKYSHTCDAQGNVIKSANFDEFISVNEMDIPMIYGSMRCVSWTLYTPAGGGEWKWTPGFQMQYNSSHNGWNIYVSTVGYHSEYMYIKQDGTLVRMTFMAGGNGNYKEYIRQNRPKIDRLAPTR